MSRPQIGVALAVLAAVSFGTWLLANRQSGQRHVSLTWQAPPPVPEVSIVGYSVYRRVTPGDRYSRIAERVSIPHFEDRLVQSGKTYFYVVTSLDRAGQESRYSREIAVAVP